MSFISDAWDWLTSPRRQEVYGVSGANPSKVKAGLSLINGINFSKGLPGSIGAPIPSVINRGSGAYTPTPLNPDSSLQRDYNRHAASGQLGSGLGDQFPSITDILGRLSQLSDPSRYMMNQQDLLALAQAQAAAQYDPVIAQLKGQESSAQGRAQRDKAALGQMFNELSSSLQGDIPAIQQNYDTTKQNTQAAYDTLNQKIQGNYDQSQAEQEALLRRLGIEAAAPDVLNPQIRDRAFFGDVANKEAQTAQTALNTEERGNVEYTRRGSEMSRTEGVQRQADLMTKLQDILASYETQIGANQAAKAQAVQAGIGQLQQQAMQQATSMSQRDFDNYLKSISMGRDLRNDNLSQALKGQVTKTQSPADVAGRALTLGLDQGSAQNLQNVFSSAISSDPGILSGLDASAGTPATKEALASRVVQKGREMGLSQPQLNALQTIALEYFGRV